MGCKFCASTLGGLVRRLEPSELLDQVIFAQKDSGMEISNIVLMGIGEPLDNFDNVMRFLELVNSPDGLNIGMRHISLSTCGLVDKIRLLAQKKLQLTLSVSLHSPDDESRSKIMPVNRRWNVEQLLAACKEYYEITGRRVSFEYTMIDGVSDSPEQAELLAKKLQGMAAHVNMIPLNSVEESGLRCSSRQAIAKFQEILERHGVTATVRRTLGSDINASCGQLRRKYEKTGRNERADLGPYRSRQHPPAESGTYEIVSFGHDRALMIVCDGMGGAKSGNIASSMAAETFVAEVRRCQKLATGTERVISILKGALELANQAVYEHSGLSDDYSGMGTTLVAAFLLRNTAVVINVGDSRAYHFSQQRPPAQLRSLRRGADGAARGADPRAGEKLPGKESDHPRRRHGAAGGGRHLCAGAEKGRLHPSLLRRPLQRDGRSGDAVRGGARAEKKHLLRTPACHCEKPRRAGQCDRDAGRDLSSRAGGYAPGAETAAVRRLRRNSGKGATYG